MTNRIIWFIFNDVSGIYEEWLAEMRSGELVTISEINESNEFSRELPRVCRAFVFDETHGESTSMLFHWISSINA